MYDELSEGRLAQAARWLQDADGLLITAGAGMGVDSGLPDFRGSEGFWRAYPALQEAGIQFQEIANPAAFRHDPALAWGFYGHRLNLYRQTVPHEGFAILRRWAARMAHGAFVFTSNVDGQFQKAGFPDDRIVECHGSLMHLQCLAACKAGAGRKSEIWPAAGLHLEIDAAACRLIGQLPLCPHCQGLARPNVLMFSDWEWIGGRTRTQSDRYHTWRPQVQRPVVIEMGAGTSIPSVRLFSEAAGAPLIRINPREPELPEDEGVAAVGLRAAALAALRALDARVSA